MFYAEITVKIPGSMSLDDRDALVEKVRETAFPDLSPDGRVLRIEWSGENEWDLRGLAEGTLEEVETEFGELRGLSDWLETDSGANPEYMVKRWQQKERDR